MCVYSKGAVKLQLPLILISLISSIYSLNYNDLSNNLCPSGMMTLYNGVGCTSDQHCQNMATGFFCYRGECCAQTPPSGYGSSCTQDAQCLYSNSQCRNNICYCQIGYNFNGFECQNPFSRHYDTIECPSGQQTLSNGNCITFVGFGNFCESTRQCNFFGGICQQKKCVCSVGQVFDGFKCIVDTTMALTSSLILLCVNFLDRFMNPSPSQNYIQDHLTFCIQDSEVLVEGICLQKRLPGQPCVHSLQCQSLMGTPDICIDNLCTPMREQSLLISGQCTPDQVKINGQCLPMANPGEQCIYDLQCRTFPGKGMYCGNNICRLSNGNNNMDWNPMSMQQRQFPQCRNPSAEVEFSSYTPKNCIFQRCSPGYHCEYNSVFRGGQYICCGTNPTNPIFG